jgi:hypothetical protein
MLISFINCEYLLLHSSHIMTKDDDRRLNSTVLQFCICTHIVRQRKIGLFRGNYNPCFLSFISLMLMVTFVQHNSSSVHVFCRTHPFTMKVSEPDYSLVKSRFAASRSRGQGCSTKTFWSDVSMTPKKMNRVLFDTVFLGDVD